MCHSYTSAGGKGAIAQFPSLPSIFPPCSASASPALHIERAGGRQCCELHHKLPLYTAVSHDRALQNLSSVTSAFAAHGLVISPCFSITSAHSMSSPRCLTQGLSSQGTSTPPVLPLPLLPDSTAPCSKPLRVLFYLIKGSFSCLIFLLLPCSLV